MPTGRSRNRGFGDDEDLMTNGAEISNVSKASAGWVGANYRIRPRIWEREGRTRQTRKLGREEASLPSVRRADA